MNERLVVLSQHWSGTASGSGSVQFVTKQPLTFHSGGIYSSSSAGGTAKVLYVGSCQGTAWLITESESGSVYKGTAALGTALTPGGTAMAHLHIPKDGTVQYIGTASAAGANMYVWTAWFVDDFGGTAYRGGSV